MRDEWILLIAGCVSGLLAHLITRRYLESCFFAAAVVACVSVGSALVSRPGLWFTILVNSPFAGLQGGAFGFLPAAVIGLPFLLYRRARDPAASSQVGPE